MNKAVDALRRAVQALGQDVGRLDDAALLRRVLSGVGGPVAPGADRPADERAASLREDAARYGEDTGSLTDTELLARECGRLADEARRHENAYSVLLQDQVKEHRAVRTEAHRSAMATMAGIASHYLLHIVREQGRDIQEVMYRARNLPESGRASADAVRGLREAALRAPEYLVTRTRMEDAARDPEVAALEQLRTEVRRLHRAVREQGQKLHAASERTPGPLCECPGCELIRSVNDTEDRS